ncbi:MAG: FAD-binding oxidoreductase [Acidimicrobiales bacterium]
MSLPPGVSDGGGTPTPPIELDAPAADIRSRFASAPATSVLAASVLADLRAVTASVDTAPAGCVEAGRDWWPLSTVWAVSGEVPARPAAVVRPADTSELSSVLRVCNEVGVPVTAAGGRSGVCGASVPAFGGVALDTTGFGGIVSVDGESLSVTVRAGTFGDRFESELRSRHGLTLGHWPQSISLSTVGGWLACRSAGQYSTRYGKIEDMVTGLEVALADGRIIRTGTTAPRSATGPDLTQLFVGSEGTLGIITEATLGVHPLPEHEERRAWSFTSFAAGLDACRRALRRGATPAVLRLYDPVESKRTFDLSEGCALIVLDEGDAGLVGATMAAVAGECGGASPLDPGLVAHWLDHRNRVDALESLIRGGLVVDTVEVAAGWSSLPDLYAATVGSLRSLDGTLAASAHQSHAYPGGACLYFTFAGRVDAAAREQYYRAAWDAVMEAVLSRGGAISHHHGIGLNRGAHMGRALGGAHAVLAGLKDTLDPRGILNPGKLGLPSPYGPPPWPPRST